MNFKIDHEPALQKVKESSITYRSSKIHSEEHCICSNGRHIQGGELYVLYRHKYDPNYDFSYSW